MKETVKLKESQLRDIVRESIVSILSEKAKSKSQQRFFGMVDANKKGELDDASPAVKKAAKGMTNKEVKDFAKTKHKGLPNHVDESALANAIQESIKKVLSENTYGQQAELPAARKRQLENPQYTPQQKLQFIETWKQAWAQEGWNDLVQALVPYEQQIRQQLQQVGNQQQTSGVQQNNQTYNQNQGRQGYGQQSGYNRGATDNYTPKVSQDVLRDYYEALKSPYLDAQTRSKYVNILRQNGQTVPENLRTGQGVHGSWKPERRGLNW